MSIFGCLVVIVFWIAFWFWFLTRKDSSLQRNIAGSPSALDGRGQFIHKVEQDENERLADMAESR